MTKGYTTKAKIEKYANITIDASMDAQIDLWIGAVEQQIDEITGRNFIADAVATARLFNGNGLSTIRIDDAVEINLVEVGDDGYGDSFQTISNSGASRYFSVPSNHTVKNVPITSIELNDGVTLTGRENVRITGKWGYSVAVPEQIEFIATVLATGIINEQRGGGEKISMEKIGTYSVSYDTNDENSVTDYKNAMTMLRSFKKIAF